MKKIRIAQAVISKKENGDWYIFFQSERQVEKGVVGSFDEIVNELICASDLEWEATDFVIRTEH